MYVETVPNRNSPPAILIRKGWRENGKVKKETLANITHLPAYIVDLIRRTLKGESFVSAEKAFEIVASKSHGHVQAVRIAMKRLGFAKLLGSRPSRNRSLVEAMIASRIILPNSKLATKRWWNTTTLAEEFGVADATEDEMYEAMDWLLERQQVIETRLAARHLRKGGLVLYDLSSSYFEGVTCPLAAFGVSRDGKTGKLQVNYGLLTNEHGCPVAVSVFEGNVSDTKTLMTQVETVHDRFGISHMVLVGDRGMISQKHIDERLRDLDATDWITALRSGSIRKLIDGGQLQLGLFDERNLFELTHPDYPGERLIACRNKALAIRRARKRQSLLKATSEELKKIHKTVENGKLRGKTKIAKQVAAVVTKKMASHFSMKIDDGAFTYKVKNKDAAAQAAVENIRAKMEKVQSEVESGRLGDSKKIRLRVDRIIDKRLSENIDLKIEHKRLHFQIADTQTARNAVLKNIYTKLDKIRFNIECGKYGGEANIGVRVGKVVNKHKMAKHFTLDIREDGFDYSINENKVKNEAALDGIYVIRTSLASAEQSSADVVRNYKRLGLVERAFRSLKQALLHIRPIYHHLETRVRSHIFLCTLSYYVEWHMLEAWRPLLFSDEDQEAKKTRDPVEPAQRSEKAMLKVESKKLEDGTEAHSFKTLLNYLGTIVRNVCRVPDSPQDAPTFNVTTLSNTKQQKAFELLEEVKVQ